MSGQARVWCLIGAWAWAPLMRAARRTPASLYCALFPAFGLQGAAPSSNNKTTRSHHLLHDLNAPIPPLCFLCARARTLHWERASECAPTADDCTWQVQPGRGPLALLRGVVRRAAALPQCAENHTVLSSLGVASVSTRGARPRSTQPGNAVRHAGTGLSTSPARGLWVRGCQPLCVRG